MASKAKKKSKVSDRFSREQAATIHAEADADKTTDGRAKIYMKHGLSRQEAAQLFRSSSLPKLSDAAPSKKTKPAAGKASKKTTKGPAKATATAPTPETKKKAPAPKAAPARKANPGLDEDVRALIALQARVISRLMGNE